MSQDWPSQDSGPNNDGNNHTEHPPTHDFQLQWTHPTDNKPHFTIIKNNLVYIADEGGHIWALDLDFGETIWEDSSFSESSGSQVNTPPEYCDGNVIVSQHNNGLRAYDANNGDLVWQKMLEGEGGVYPELAYTGELIVSCNTSDYIVYAREAQSGELAWAKSISDYDLPNDASIYGGLAFKSEYIYAGTYTGEVIKIDAASGDLVWKTYIESGGDSIIFGPVEINGYIICGEFLDDMHCLDAETGEELWMKTLGGYLGDQNPTITNNDTVLVPTTRDSDTKPATLFELNPKTGSTLHELPIPSNLSVTVSGDYLYTRSGSSNMEVYYLPTYTKISEIPDSGVYGVEKVPVIDNKILVPAGFDERPTRLYEAQTGVEYHEYSQVSFLPGKSEEPTQLRGALPYINKYTYLDKGEAAMFDAWHHSDEINEPLLDLDDMLSADRYLKEYDQEFRKYRLLNQIGVQMDTDGQNIDYDYTTVLFNGFSAKYDDQNRDPDDFEFKDIRDPPPSTLEGHDAVYNPFRDRIENEVTKEDGSEYFDGELKKPATIANRYYNIEPDTIVIDGNEMDAIRIGTILGGIVTYALEMQAMDDSDLYDLMDWEVFTLLDLIRKGINSKSLMHEFNTPAPAIFSWIELIVCADGTTIGMTVDESPFPKHGSYIDTELKRISSLEWEPDQEQNSSFEKLAMMDLGFDRFDSSISTLHPYHGLFPTLGYYQMNRTPIVSIVGQNPDGTEMSDAKIVNILEEVGFPIDPTLNKWPYSSMDVGDTGFL